LYPEPPPPPHPGISCSHAGSFGAIAEYNGPLGNQQDSTKASTGAEPPPSLVSHLLREENKYLAELGTSRTIPSQVSAVFCRGDLHFVGARFTTRFVNTSLAMQGYIAHQQQKQLRIAHAQQLRTRTESQGEGALQVEPPSPPPTNRLNLQAWARVLDFPLPPRK